MSNQETVVNAPATKVTSRSIAMNILLANLPLRVQYSGKKAFSIEKQEDRRSENQPNQGMFNSYTDFRQVTRDMIIAATGCSAASARTMFIYAKDRVIEQCKADGTFTIQVDGKDVVLTPDTLSLKRDLKPKPEKAPKATKEEPKVEAEKEQKVEVKATKVAKKTANAKVTK